MVENKTAVVTGGSTGIGKAIAARLLEEGANVVIANRSVEKGEATAEELGCAFYPCDVSEYAAVEDLIDYAVEEFGGLDILVNNAGIGSQGTVEEMALDDWETLMSINLNGVMYATRAALPHLRASEGCILNVASVYGLVGGPGVAAYATAKGALINFTRTTAIDYAADGVRVNSICPGFVETPMTDPVLEEESFYQYVRNHTPMERIASPEEVAGPAAFLVSEDASYITGANVPVDGGWTTH